MQQHKKTKRMKQFLIVALSGALALLAGCGKSSTDTAGGSAGSGNQAKQSIQNIGSDTMVNLAQAWAEAYDKVDPSVSVEVSGGGSGIGIAALINGTCDIAQTSRKLEPEAFDKPKTTHGHAPKEYPVGYDALPIYCP